MLNKTKSSRDFTQYLLDNKHVQSDGTSLPNLTEISKELDVSVSILREQLEAAKVLGFVEVRPRVGVRPLPYSFLPAVRESLFYALGLDPEYFDQFARLRNNVEASFWYEAVSRLDSDDQIELRGTVALAWKKLNSPQIQIPHEEHKQLHLVIFRKLDNPFVTGILEAYWDAYEIVGLNLYTDYDYLRKVWEFHENIVEAICRGDFHQGYQKLIEHSELLNHRPVQPGRTHSIQEVAR
jgi:DNA-binding FadR family transcriptional regulator